VQVVDANGQAVGERRRACTTIGAALAARSGLLAELAVAPGVLG
jgi:hypothetical protein